MSKYRCKIIIDPVLIVSLTILCPFVIFITIQKLSEYICDGSKTIVKDRYSSLVYCDEMIPDSELGKMITSFIMPSIYMMYHISLLFCVMYLDILTRLTNLMNF